MILGFKQYFPWHTEKNPAPTYFREKILAGSGYAWRQVLGKDLWVPDKCTVTNILDYYTPKRHTIREGNRWKEGDLIHMAYGVRTKNYQQFNKGIPELERVKSVQKIEIKWINRSLPTGAEVKIDNKWLSLNEIKVVAINDGFDSVEDFFRWFNKDFTGQLIHWTDLKY